YPHWRFGMQYEYMQKSYGYGLHKIYEMVINNNPCYAYLLNSNQMVDQKLVIAHVFAHCDFFKNNAYFRNTNRRMMDELANHGNRIQDYMAEHGHDVVEDFIDVCSSLENLIDPGALFENGARADEPEPSDARPARDVARLRSKSYMEPFINPPEYLEERRRARDEQNAVKTFPARAVKDVLRFLVEYAPLANWKRDVLSMMREESYYFAPQAQTKIMNEGWASYWHEKIMTQKALTPDEIVDFADHHSSTLAVHPGQLNPYKLGYELYCDIERRWNTGRFGKEYEECDDIARRAAWNRETNAGREKIFQVRAIYNDMTFVDEFLTEEFCREHRLFTYSLNERNGRYEIADREFQAVKEKLLFQLTNMGQPFITVVDANYDNRGELYLKHRFDGVELRIDYARATLEALFKIWSRPVHVQTVVGDTAMLLSYDGGAHRERTFDASNAA
ncbi:MAG TPA: SpoVR family protein, partial [Candidatus Krumholzibacteria bacterium]|nr:SpoVR family protein [Candidatus Krumholzibacteria bacterium]